MKQPGHAGLSDESCCGLLAGHSVCVGGLSRRTDVGSLQNFGADGGVKSHALPLLRAFEAVALNCGEMGEKIEALIIPGHKKRTFETTGSKGQNSGMMKDEIGEVRIEQPYTCLNCQRTMRLSPQISKTTFIYFQ